MNTNGQRLEPPDLSKFHQNRQTFSLDELAKHAGKHVAFSPDGTRIVASADTEEELDAALNAAGVPCSQVVYSYIYPSDMSLI